MADIYFKCACGKRLAVDANAAGRMVNCPDCAARFEIPQADFEWVCPNCAAPMAASEDMRGMKVQCVSCQAEVQAPAPPIPAAPPPGLSLKKNAAPPVDHPAAGRFNDMLKVCPQCHEQIPINTQGCPFCNFSFTKPKPKGLVVGALAGMILAGVFLGLWQAKIWPFASARTSAPMPPPAAVPAELPPPSNAVVAAPIPAPMTVALVATNIPAAPPPAARAVSRAEWLGCFEPARQLIAAQLDRDYPRCPTNVLVSLRQMDGIMVHGTNVGVQDAGILLIMDGKPEVIAFQNLDVPGRLKVDDEFRWTWIDAHAAALNRWSLEQSGITIPGLASNRNEFLDAALTLGDPQAQYQVGQQCYKQKDYAYAVLYLRAAARTFAPAQYALGMIYYQGTGLGVDKKTGATWMTLAAAQGHARSEQFLQQHKVSMETVQKLLRQEQARRERESQEWAALIKLPRQSAAAVPPAPAAPLTLELPVALTDPATGRSYVYRRGKKTYQE